MLAVIDAATQTDGYDLPSTQQASNYGYTELGELKQDVQDSIAEIKRRVDGKITEVIRTTGSTKKNLKFDYDATGNRIAKHVYTNDGTWIKSEFYVRDAQGNILSTYNHALDESTLAASFKQTERHLYGSSLLGIDQTQTELIGTPPASLTSFSRTLGMKGYTGSNHLENDLVIFTDKKIGIDDDNDGFVDYYIPDVISAKDYGPFGEYLTGRIFNANDYPNSFNGKRDDEELFGWQDYGFRNYMKAVRRFDRVDDLHKDFPWYSPYPFAGNKPIWAIDLDGLEEYISQYLVNNGEVTLIKRVRNVELREKMNTTADGRKIGSGIYDRYNQATGQPFRSDEIGKEQYQYFNKEGKRLHIKRNLKGEYVKGSNEMMDIHRKNFGNSIYISYPFGEDAKLNDDYDYRREPTDLADAGALEHDKRYDKVDAEGSFDALFNNKTVGADLILLYRMDEIIKNAEDPNFKDPYTGEAVSEKTLERAKTIKSVFTPIVKEKLLSISGSKKNSK